jgi:hypothetical protein
MHLHPYMEEFQWSHSWVFEIGVLEKRAPMATRRQELLRIQAIEFEISIGAQGYSPLDGCD